MILRLLPVAMLLVTSMATAQTREFLTARVESRVRVQWDPALRRLVASVNDVEPFRALTVSPAFLTTGTLAVTYPRLNPLRVAVTIASNDAAEASDTVMPRLRALLYMSAVSVPSSRDAGNLSIGAFALSTDSCPALTTARADAEAVVSRLWVTRSSVTVAALISSWRRSIDDAFAAGQDGPAAVSAAVALIDRFVTQLDTQLGESDRILTRTAGELAKAPSAQPCETSTRAVYEMLNLANPRARMAQMTAVRSAAMSLRDALSRDYIAGAARRWQRAEYHLADIRPTREPATVTIRVTHLQFDVDESSGAPIAIDESNGSETVVAQRFSRFAREFAVASVLSSVTRLGYGTTTNEAGATVVSRLPRPIASVEPAVLASFVCRCRTGPLVAPMLQAGVTTSKDVPALLGGGGIRLFGLPKGDVALGAGGMIAWVKDLGTLRVGDPVGGTTDIEANLHYVRRNGWYVALQYKF